MTLLALVVAVTAGAQTNWPYNPDSDNDGLITVEDLFSLLSAFGNDFEAAGLNIQTVDPDSLTQEYWYTPNYWSECCLSIVDGLYKSEIEIQEETDVLYIDFQMSDYFGREYDMILPAGETMKTITVIAMPPDTIIHNNPDWTSSTCQYLHHCLGSTGRLNVFGNTTLGSEYIDFEINGITVSTYHNDDGLGVGLGAWSDSPHNIPRPIIETYIRIDNRWSILYEKAYR